MGGGIRNAPERSVSLAGGCVSGAWSQAGVVDRAVGLAVGSNIDCAPAKLVDLDPQFQFESMI